MDITRVTLEGESLAVFNEISNAVNDAQCNIDNIQEEYQEAINQVNKVKAKIIPLKQVLSPLVELQASIASRKSRAKYFPEFATRNYDTSKDEEFLAFVKQHL